MNKENAEEILRRDVSEFGTGAHIVIPSKHKGKKAIIYILGEEDGFD